MHIFYQIVITYRIKTMIEKDNKLNILLEQGKIELISAEEILIESDPDKWKEKIDKAYAHEQMKNRISMEENGVKDIKSGKYNQETIDNLTETDFVQFLDTNDLPEPDLIIRTGGDIRLSGFLSWQNQYSELFFTKTLMPDFSTKEFDKILTEYSQRDRRFGGNTKK